MAINLNCEDNKVEMPCNCLPPPPDTPNPIIFAWANGVISRVAKTEFLNTAFLSVANNYPFKFQADGSGALQYIGPGTFYGGGDFYKKTPIIKINGPTTGVAATAIVNLNGNRRLSSVTMTNNGTGYTPFSTYYGYEIYEEPLTDTHVIIYDIDGFTGSTAIAYGPLVQINSYTPPTGWAPEVNSQIKCIFKINVAVKRDTVGTIRGRFLVNGIAEPNSMRVYNSMESKLIKITHYSREITINPTDTIAYEISTPDGDHLDYTGHIIGVYHAKTL